MCYRHFVTAGLWAALISATPANAARAPLTSWGKPGVSYADYLRDSVECGVRGHYLDVGATRQAQNLREATTRLEAVDGSTPNALPVSNSATSGGGGGAGGGAAADPIAAAVTHARQIEAVRAAARPDKQIRELREIMVAEVGKCLTERGYRPFVLDAEQMQRLSEFKRGSDERRHYLHTLAADHQVLERQAARSS